MENPKRFRKGVLAGYEIPERISKDELDAIAKTKLALERDAKSKRIATKRQKRNDRAIKVAQANPIHAEADAYRKLKSSSASQERTSSKSVKTWQGGACTPR